MTNTGLQKDQKQNTTAATEATRNLTYTPRVDILEREDELVLFADVPGVKQGDVDLRFEKGELVLNCRCAPRHTDVNMLMQEYGVAYDTIRRATALLRDRGLIITIVGRGTYVTPAERG